MDLLKTKRHRKANGVHYTPYSLSKFLAEEIWQHASGADLPRLTILDPACGDGRLLKSLLNLIPTEVVIEAVGFERDADAANDAKHSLRRFSNCRIEIRNEDFLEYALQTGRPQFDIVITNPPYVRTQVLGQARSREIAKQFGLSGRIDLYHAFSMAVTKTLKNLGWMGLLTSNRFMYVQSGAAMRKSLSDHYDLETIVDFGETRLFSAAVLPVVVVGQRRAASNQPERSCAFTRVSEVEKLQEQDRETKADLFNAVRNQRQGDFVRHGRNLFQIERGWLNRASAAKSPWTLASTISTSWLDQIAKHQAFEFADVAEIKVGIKTTADAVFIRDNWQYLPPKQIPEQQLLRPLITHHVADRWRARRSAARVLYPYLDHDLRTPIDLDEFPKTARYLLPHQHRLRSRKYLTAAGRQWFEIWVPQRPREWSLPKIVWPDISEHPTFFLDKSGSIVNGDCYWIKLKDGWEQDWLYLMLAIANSTLAVQFYDYRFHNKLYGRRRRFMTQYVNEFPLPHLDLPISQQIVKQVKQLLHLGFNNIEQKENLLESLVQQSFGFE